MSEGYIYNVIFLLIAIFVWSVSRYCYPVSKRLIRIFVFFWLVNSFVIACGLITYDVIFTLKTFTYQSIFFGLGVLGIWFGTFGVRSPDRADPLTVQVLNPRSTLVMIVCSSIFVVVSLFELSALITIMITDFSSLRRLHWSQFVNEDAPGIYDALMAFSGGVAFFAFLTFFTNNNNTRGWLYCFAAILAGLFFLNTLSVGGRAYVFFVIFAAVYLRTLFKPSARIRSVSSILKRSLLFCFVLFGGAWFMVIFPAVRGGIEYTDLDYFLSLRHNAAISDHVRELDHKIPGLSELAFATEYFSTPTVKMTDLIENLDTSDTYAFGMNSFSVPAKIISLFTDTNLHSSVRFALENKIASQGYYATRPWTTIAQDFALDFGLVGGVVMCFFCTFLLSKAYVWGFKANSSEGYALCSLIALNLVIFAFKSPFNIPFVANALFAGFFLCLLGFKVARATK